MSLQLLVSSMNGLVFDKPIAPYLKGSTEFTIINQYTQEDQKITHPKVINMPELGLAKSRNKALRSAYAGVALFCDDDQTLVPDFEKKILKAFFDNPNADIITFQIQTPEGTPFRNYSKTPFIHNSRTLMGVASIEIAFRPNTVLRTPVRFDERFGLGTKYAIGEENIFLLDALQAGLQVAYVPIAIAVHPRESSGSIKSPQTLFARGAFFIRGFGGLKGHILCWLYFFKNFGQFKSPFSALKNLLLGQWDFFINNNL